jgi:hypothetical protein
MFKTCIKNFMVLSVALLAIPSFSQVDDGVPPGYDLWQTIGGGATAMSFNDSAIPQDFFCEGSSAFTGRITFDGIPLKTSPKGALGGVDTIVERIDFATFDDKGFAYSRMQAKALAMKSRAPIETECGEWDLTVSLTKQQPVTEIAYERTSADGGAFYADLVLNVRLVFTSRFEKGLTRELERTVHFGKFTEIPFRIERSPEFAQLKRQSLSQIKVDSDGDNIPDLSLALAQTKVNTSTSSLAPITAEPEPIAAVSGPVVHTAPLHSHAVAGYCTNSQGQFVLCSQVALTPTLAEAKTLLGQLQDLKDQGVLEDEPEAVWETMVNAAEGR